MQKRDSVLRVFLLLAGAVLLAAALLPLSLRVFHYATSFSVFVNGEIADPAPTALFHHNPSFPLLFTVLSPLAGLLTGALAGGLSAWALSRVRLKNSLPTGRAFPLRVCLGVLLLCVPAFFFLRPDIWGYPNHTVEIRHPLLLILWWISLCAYFIWLVRGTFPAKQPAPEPKFMRVLPLLLSGLLLIYVLLCMVFRAYPISTLLLTRYAIPLVNAYDVPPITSDAQYTAYLSYLSSAVHPVVVGCCAFLLSGWLTGRKLKGACEKAEA